MNQHVQTRSGTRAPEPAASTPLPSPPTDAERDGYFARTFGPLTAISALAVLGVAYSAAIFALRTGMVLYLGFVGLTLAYMAISLCVNAFTKDASLDDHRRKVEGWLPDAIRSVDVFLPTCGEDIAILRNTWRHVRALSWPGQLCIYVLDDRADPEARAMAEEFGFTYLSRPDRGWFKKAGNLKYGYERSEGEFVVIFDADFCPRTDFLYELMPYFDDPNVGIVQSPQYFRVLDGQGWLERGAGAVQEFFYRVVQTSRQRRDGAICVGTNAVYRRAALECNGGTTLVEHSEDVHTGFDLRALGWDLRYVPTCVATGISPDDLAAYFRQQYRWCMGSMSLLRSRKFWTTKMRLRSRLCYLTGFAYYLHTAVATFATPLVPLVLLFAFPSMVRIENYLLLVPAFLQCFVVFPAWHRCRYGLEAFTVRMIYGWAHLFAITDIARRRPMGWTPTGASGRPDRRVTVFRAGVAMWGCGTAIAWVGAAVWRGVQRPVDFAPMILLGVLQLLVMGRMFTTTKAQARKPMRRATMMRVAVPMLALAGVLTGALATAAHAADLKLGVAGEPENVATLKQQGLPVNIRATFEAWSLQRTPDRALQIARSLDAQPMITWEPWAPIPSGTKVKPQRGYTNRAIARGAQDAYVRRFARTLKAYRGVVYLRYAHEMNGTWYPWSRDAVQYRKAWRHVWQVFQHEGARNVRWVWSVNPNTFESDSTFDKRVRAYWPGRRYVDLVGSSLIRFQTQGNQNVAWSLARLQRLRWTHRPMMLSEVKVDVEEADDWLATLRCGLADRPWITALVWSETPSRLAERDPRVGTMNWSLTDHPVERDLVSAIATGRPC